MAWGMTVFKDHFSSNAAKYAAHRPTYPTALVDFLTEVAPERNLALDCGCGTGQLSVLLASRFKRVIATDASPQQIANATPHQGIEYRTAPAEDSGLPDRSADLVTAGQAAHWFDLEAFYAEVWRVARPRAILALIAYGVLHVEGDTDELVQRFYGEVLGPYWPPERRHVEDGYRNLPFPCEGIETPALGLEVSWALVDLIGYIGTWSGVKEYEKARGRASVDDFYAELREGWGDPAARRTVRWPLSLRVGRI